MIRAIRRFALAGVSLLAMTAHASADPISIGSFIISGFLSAGLGTILPVVSAATIGNFVIGAAVVAANIAVSAFGARRPSIDPGEFKNIFEETGNQSEIRAVGRVRVGGLRAFGNTTGLDRYRLICHTKGRWTATEEHYLGGREVVVDEQNGGVVSSPPWTLAGGSSYVFIKSRIGDGSETAWPELVSAFPSLWSSAHRLRGIHQTLAKYVSPGLTSDKFLRLYQGGEPPYEKVGRAEPIYDPREGGQSATSEATWQWTDNGELCAAHILRAYPSLAATDLDYDDIALEAAKADALVATLTGTEPRARCWGFWPSEGQRGDIMEQVLRSIGAEIVPVDDGAYTIRLVDDTRVAQISFTARHIVDLQWRSGPESVERPNICRVKYYAPERNYQMTEIDLTGITWARVEDEIDRVGEQFYDVDLPFCPSASQAQRIARRLFALARADAGILKTNFAGLAAWGLSVADIELPDLDVTETCAIGTPRVNDDEGTVEIPFIVWPLLSAWNPATDEAPAPESLPELQYESTLDTPAKPSAATQVEYPDTSREVRLSFTSVAGAATAEANYRTYSGALPDSWSSMSEVGLTLAYVAADLEGEKVDFRVRFFDGNQEPSYFSEVLEIASLAIDNSAPAAPSVGIVTSFNGSNWQDVLTINSSAINAVELGINGAGDAGGFSYLADFRPGAAVVVVNSNPSYNMPTGRSYNVFMKTSNGTSGAVTVVASYDPGGGP